MTFSGSAGAGCQARGLCPFSGTETWNPSGDGDLAILDYREHGQRGASVTLAVGGFSSPVSSVVQQTIPNAALATCRDLTKSSGGFFDLPVAAGAVDVGLDHGTGATFGTRCAGPLDEDLTHALPQQSVSLSQLRRGQMTIDLAGSAPFTAGGFAGTVTSTITLTLGRPYRQSVPSSKPTPSTGAGTRLTTVTYRVTHLSGSTSATVKVPEGARGCGELDACGLNGTILVVLQAGPGGSAFLTASASAHRPQRDVLTALGIQTGGQTTGISVGGVGNTTTGGAVSETLSADPIACTDQVSFQQSEIILREQAGRLVVSLSPELSAAADPLRTRCPGPRLGTHQLTSVSLPLSTLRHARFTVHLHGVSFRNGPFTVTSHATLSVTLERKHVDTEVLPSLDFPS